MSKFWKIATLIGVGVTMVIWGMLVLDSMTESFLQDCFQLGEGAYCADYVYTPFGKVVMAGAVMVPIMTIGIFIIGKIKKLETEAKREEVVLEASD